MIKIHTDILFPKVWESFEYKWLKSTFLWFTKLGIVCTLPYKEKPKKDIYIVVAYKYIKDIFTKSDYYIYKYKCPYMSYYYYNNRKLYWQIYNDSYLLTRIKIIKKNIVICKELHSPSLTLNIFSSSYIIKPLPCQIYTLYSNSI